MKWLYTFEGTFGNVNYESPGSGTMNTNYYKARLENYLSYKFEKYEKVTPFIVVLLIVGYMMTVVGKQAQKGIKDIIDSQNIIMHLWAFSMIIFLN